MSEDTSIQPSLSSEQCKDPPTPKTHGNPNTQKPPSPKDTPKSLFSGFGPGAKTRMTGCQSLERKISLQRFEDVFYTRKDLYEYNSHSQEFEVQSRRQRNKPSTLMDSLDTGSNSQVVVSSGPREGEGDGRQQTCTLSS